MPLRPKPIAGPGKVNRCNHSGSFPTLAAERDSLGSLLVWEGKSFYFLNTALRGKKIHLPHFSGHYLVVQNNALRHLSEVTDGMVISQGVLRLTNHTWLLDYVKKRLKKVFLLTM